VVRRGGGDVGVNGRGGGGRGGEHFGEILDGGGEGADLVVAAVGGAAAVVLLLGGRLAGRGGGGGGGGAERARRGLVRGNVDAVVVAAMAASVVVHANGNAGGRDSREVDRTGGPRHCLGVRAGASGSTRRKRGRLKDKKRARKRARKVQC